MTYYFFFVVFDFTEDTDTELTLETGQGRCPVRSVLEIALITMYNYNIIW